MSDSIPSQTRSFNNVLAERYFAVASQYTSDIENYIRQRRIIREADIDITAFYDSCGSLKDLRVKGLGPKSKRILETILREGDESRGIIAREREGDLNHKPKERYSNKVEEVLPRLGPSNS